MIRNMPFLSINLKIVQFKDIYKVFLSLVICTSICSMLKCVKAEDCRPSDCILSDWSTWSSCSVTCGDGGSHIRKREIQLKETCGGTCDLPLVDSKPCSNKCCPRNCQFTQWTEWTEHCACQKSCAGIGEDRHQACYRFRQKTSNAECGGYCESKTIDVRCGDRCCYRDCSVTEWEEWGSCVAQCEQEGVRNRRRFIAKYGDCGGHECPDLYQEELCQGPCCPQDCVVGQWSVWSTCDATCGSGVQTRRRMVQQGLCGGQPCPMNTSYRDVRACEAFVHMDCVVRCSQLNEYNKSFNLTL